MYTLADTGNALSGRDRAGSSYTNGYACSGTHAGSLMVCRKLAAGNRQAGLKLAKLDGRDERVHINMKVRVVAWGVLAPAPRTDREIVMNEHNHGRVQGIALGFLAGYVDTLGFLALFGLFTAHVTGNFILIGAALADPGRAPVLLKLLAFPAFIAGVALARMLVVVIEKRKGVALRPALLLQLALLLGFMGFGVAASPMGQEAGPLGMTAGLLGAAAMGVHSATSKLLLANLAPTSMMTGNVTQITIDVVDYVCGADRSALGARFNKIFWPLAAFAAGCVAAAFGYHWFGFAALVVPILILLGLLLTEAPTVARQEQANAS